MPNTDAPAPLRGRTPLTDVPPQHALDLAALDRFLRGALPAYAGDLAIAKFGIGQSNPTYKITARSRDGGALEMVLRKKPAGHLLKGAHQVDREYRVITALKDTGVPLPRTHALCTDPAVLGQDFYLMDYVDGRILEPRETLHLTNADRSAIFDSMNEVLVRLHQVDIDAVGLSDFGRHGAYFERQISVWSRQYRASTDREMPDMDFLMQWLPANIPFADETCVVHGDYRLGNVLLHPTEPRVVAVLDWELSTLGHPLADLAWNSCGYNIGNYPSGMADLDLQGLGIPTESQYLDLYCRRAGRAAIAQWDYARAFALFRMAAILIGIYRRGLDGTASSPEALGKFEHAATAAALARRIAAG
ncbi:MAG: phosphotransferase family protein [Gammaproteobacteria bacterium]